MSENDTFVDVNRSNYFSIKYIALLTLETPSILLSLIIFYHFITCRAVRSTSHQHSILVLLITNFLIVAADIPISIDFYRVGGYVQSFTNGFCLWWIWFDFTLYGTNTFLMAWISIERHIFIFHSHFLNNQSIWKRRVFHYSPIIFSITWPIIFYSLVFFIVPICTNILSPFTAFCNQQCYFPTIWGTFDLFFNMIFPVFLILIANLALLMRVFHHQSRGIRQQRINWRNRRRMILQLTTISTFYLAIWGPISIAVLGQTFFNPEFMIEEYGLIYFFMYIFPQILPAICISSIPQLVKRLKIIWSKLRPKPVAPVLQSMPRS